MLEEERTPEYVVFRAAEVPEPPVLFSLLLAEAIHVLATAFDHVAWALVSEETRINQNFARSVQMPVVLRDQAWEGLISRKLRGMPAKYEPTVRSIQPFERVKRAEPRPGIVARAADFDLSYMRGLDNAAKHRAHHLARVSLPEPLEWHTITPADHDKSLRFERYSGGGLVVGLELFKMFIPERYTVTMRQPRIDISFLPSATLSADDERFTSLAIPHGQFRRLISDLVGTLNRLVDGIDTIDSG
ncbi:hypothetical protein [Glaciibacter sp. 2TAF33]|uniref:hypothetical protein n=1 Tax=Glaciibacter sp. 2TAF33 TaxID=3233015 RepID=UPI003F8DDEDB